MEVVSPRITWLMCIRHGASRRCTNPRWRRRTLTSRPLQLHINLLYALYSFTLFVPFFFLGLDRDSPADLSCAIITYLHELELPFASFSDFCEFTSVLITSIRVKHRKSNAFPKIPVNLLPCVPINVTINVSFMEELATYFRADSLTGHPYGFFYSLKACSFENEIPGVRFHVIKLVLQM